MTKNKKGESPKEVPPQINSDTLNVIRGNMDIATIHLLTAINTNLVKIINLLSKKGPGV